MRIKRTAVAVLAAAMIAGSANIACAAGTGDLQAKTRDKPTAQTLKVEQAYQSWLGAHARGGVSASIVDAPYKYIWTPTHEQQNGYYCGPATVQIIDDYWGTAATQATLASYMGTTSSGTDFTKVDDALRHFTGRGYAYHTCSSDGDFLSSVTYGLISRNNPIATDLNIIGSAMNYYVYSHSGHIVTIEGYDARSYPTKVRLNDPYDEAGSRAGGGNTLGHKTYPASQITYAVMRHFRHAVVY